MTGVFTLLYQFCGSVGCPGVDEGANPAYHLVQTADSTLYGVTTVGGNADDGGTLFSASTSGAVTTLHNFSNAVDGSYPTGALLIGPDGSTLYGVDSYNVFSYGVAGLTILHSFDPSPFPEGALIFGPDGLIYGYTVAGDQNGSLYSLSTTGGDFTVDTLLPGTFNAKGLLLGSDGMIYGTMTGIHMYNSAGGVFVYNPTSKALRSLVKFGNATGDSPEAALIEGKDHYLYGSNSAGDPGNSFGAAAARCSGLVRRCTNRPLACRTKS